jgi:hypothetical protein
VEAMMRPKSFTIEKNCSPFATSQVTTSFYKPWLDFDDGKNVLFTSVHLHDNDEEKQGGVFYPGTGSLEENTTVEETSIYPGGILNVPLAPGHASAEDWRREFTEKVFPRLIEF